MGMRIVGGRTASIAFAAADANNSNPLNTFNMTGVSFGPESPRRQMLVLTYALNANLVSDTNYVTSVTIGSVAATRIYNTPGAQIQHRTAWMTDRTEDGGPAGATGNVATTRSTGNGFNTIAVAMFALYDLRDPSLGFFDAAEAVGNPTAQIAIDIPGAGLIAAMAQSDDETVSITWTGATEVYDVADGVANAQRFSGAMASKVPAANGYEVEAGNATDFVRLFGLSFK